ncbi:DUF5325 family protein [Shouchella lonarensis]|uniref:YlaF family protein n=1 Tax=Shouchella lonarensis TaxID=1464122 RepID=A0A1G6KTE7_9BACI|nr:DUF5325 family protein [Shouchella lonarensis]SDC33646.1 hypothetical protein SAMN05421737_107128 [Shouchella lonarensis]
MKKDNILFLLLAMITVAGIMCIGVAVAERSVWIAFIACIGIFLAMTIGFRLRKKNEARDER